jgi:hypothetical protein
MAAKMEEPLSPSITRMIRLLTTAEQKSVDKTSVLQMEEKFLKMLNFDLNLICPLPFLERFIRLFGL